MSGGYAQAGRAACSAVLGHSRVARTKSDGVTVDDGVVTIDDGATVDDEVAVGLYDLLTIHQHTW